MSLQSQCRLCIRQALGVHKLDRVADLGLVKPFDDFVAFRELFISAGQLIFDNHIGAIKKVNKVLREVTEEPPKRRPYANCPAKMFINQTFSSMPEQMANFVQDQVQEPSDEPEVVQGAAALLPNQGPPPPPGAPAPPPPPPPPPQPIPPRPGFWRFPGAEFSDKGVHR